MVLIIDGEIVQDNDPRAIARRKPSTASPSRPAGANVAGVHGGGGGGASNRAPGGGGGARGAGQSPLDALADAIGIGGMSVTVPRLHARVPAREVPMVAAGIVGLLTMLFGWRVLAGCVLMHVFAGFSETAPQVANPRPGPGSGGPVGGGGSGGAPPRR